MWDVGQQEPSRIFTQTPSGYTQLRSRFDLNDRFIVHISAEQNVAVWDFNDAADVWLDDGGAGKLYNPTSVAIAKDSGFICANFPAGTSNIIRLWDAYLGHAIGEITEPGDFVLSSMRFGSSCRTIRALFVGPAYFLVSGAHPWEMHELDLRRIRDPNYKSSLVSNVSLIYACWVEI